MTQTEPHATAHVADGMLVERDVPIPMDDGLVLRADVFRPQEDGAYAVVLSYGPYAKNLAFQEGYPSAWQRLVSDHPDVVAGTTSKYQNWEVADPEKWVPDGYAVVRVDSRGCGRSPGYIDHFSERETRDLYECIEWAGVQPWSNGRVGLSGVSYYAMNQWLVAGLQPPHLAAICPWEGASDWYRDATHHGGILSTFWANWYDMQVKGVQHGLGVRGPRDPNTGQLACGDETLGDEQLAANRADFGEQIRAHPRDDDYHRSRSPVWERVTVPMLTAGNWGGAGLHLRGNVEGFVRSASAQKWLEMHGLEHWTSYYTDYGVQLQKRFFGHFLQGRDTGWDRQPRVLLQVRHADGSFEQRAEDDWPLPDTDWRELHLDARDATLSPQPPQSAAAVAYDPAGDGATFWLPALDDRTEVTGPVSVRLFISSATSDADVFVVLRAFAPDGEEVVFQGAIDPHTPVAQGWLRASHRRLDPRLTLPYRPHHSHDDPAPLAPGEVVQLDVEVWPTSVVLPAGYRLALSVRGRDYVYPRAAGERLSNFKNALTGVGPFLHDDPVDRPSHVYGGRVTVHTGPQHPSRLLLPVIPPRR